MKQKADHHLEFLVDKNDRGTNSLLPLLPAASESSLSHRAFAASSSSLHRQSSFHLRPSDDDAAGESDDAAGDPVDQLHPDHSFHDRSFRLKGEKPQQHLKVGSQEGEAGRGPSPSRPLLTVPTIAPDSCVAYRRSVSRARRDTSVGSGIRSASHTNGFRGSVSFTCWHSALI